MFIVQEGDVGGQGVKSPRAKRLNFTLCCGAVAGFKGGM